MIRFFRNPYMASRLVARCFLVALLSTACIRHGQGEVATEDSLVITSVATLERDTPSVLAREVDMMEEALSSGNNDAVRKSLDAIRAQLEQIEAGLVETQVARRVPDSLKRRALPVDSVMRGSAPHVDEPRLTQPPVDSLSRSSESFADSLKQE